MKLKRILAAAIAAVMCASMAATAFAVGEDESTTEGITNEQTTVESTTEEISTEENSSEEASTQEMTTSPEVSEEESSSEENAPEEPSSEEESSKEEESSSEETSTEEPTEDDVIALIIKLLGQINFEEVKDTLNDINEALGLPRVEHFTDIPAYADAIYEKLDEMGLGYGDIINGLASSDLLDWLNNLLFGGGNKPGSTTTTVPSSSGNSNSDKGESTPDTGLALGAGIAAVSTMGISSALAFVLRKRSKDEE